MPENVRETFGTMGYIDEQGNQSIHYPITQAELAIYDNTASGLSADNVQAAIDEIKSAVDGAKALTGTTDPTISTPGEIGQHYTNTITGAEFTCVAINTVEETTTYTWKSSGGDGKVDLDANSAVAFSFGCDSGGFYVITPDEEEESV